MDLEYENDENIGKYYETDIPDYKSSISVSTNLTFVNSNGKSRHKTIITSNDHMPMTPQSIHYDSGNGDSNTNMIFEDSYGFDVAEESTKGPIGEEMHVIDNEDSSSQDVIQKYAQDTPALPCQLSHSQLAQKDARPSVNTIPSHLLEIFHRYYYPAKLIYKMYDPALLNSPFDTRRSIATTDSDNVLRRYTFANSALALQNIFEKSNIVRVDIGAIYMVADTRNCLPIFVESLPNIVPVPHVPIARVTHSLINQISDSIIIGIYH
jgi:hypothetical protein